MKDKIAGAGSRKPKIIYSLNNPYPLVEWPSPAANEQHIIVDLLSELLAPIGYHRSIHVTPSKGKRAKKRKRKQLASALEDADASAPPDSQAVDSRSHTRPALSEHLTVGFNSTTRHLESLAQASKIPEASSLAHMAAVFVPIGGGSNILHSQFPLLCKVGSSAHPSLPETRLVALPKGIEERLASSLGIHRIGPIGLMEGAPESEPLLNYVREKIKPLEIPWLGRLTNGEFVPTQIKAIETTVFVKDKAQRDPVK